MEAGSRKQKIAYHNKWLGIWIASLAVFLILGFISGIAAFISYLISDNYIFQIVAELLGSISLLCGYKTYKHAKALSGLSQRPGEEVLQELLREGKPYAVYLRNFGHEANEAALKHPEANFTGATPKRSVEIALKETFGNEMPIIALSNPKEPYLDGVYRIEAVADDWLKTLQELMEKARLVILYLSVLTPNIQREFDLISSLKLNEFTIVIVSRKLAVEYTKKGEEIRKLLSGFENLFFERQYSWWKVLTRYPEKVSLYKLKKRLKRALKELNARRAA